MPPGVGLGDGDGAEVEPEVVELALVPARDKWQHNSATQARLKEESLNKM